MDNNQNNPQEVPQVKSVEEQIKQSYGIDFEFLKPYIDFKTGIAKVPSKINRSNLDRGQFKIWIDIEAPKDCQFYECFKPHSLNIEVQHKTIERLLVDLQDELHYQSYPSDNPVPIYKEEELNHDYFPLHMIKIVCDRYTQFLIAELEAKNKKYMEALEGANHYMKMEPGESMSTEVYRQIAAKVRQALKPKDNG